jgi:hypothetical protein
MRLFLFFIFISISACSNRDLIEKLQNDSTKISYSDLYINSHSHDDHQRPFKVVRKKDSHYTFDVWYYLKYFPDVTIHFSFTSVPTQEVLDEVTNEVKKYRDKYQTILVHDMRIVNEDYSISINHNTIDYSTYSELNYISDINNLTHLLSSINNNNKISGLKKITFE